MQRAWNTNLIIHNCKYERERPLLRAQNGRSEHCRWCLAGVRGRSEAPDSGFQAFRGIIFQKQADAEYHTKDHRGGHTCKPYFPKMAVRSENHFVETKLNVFWNCRIPRSDILDFCSVHFRFYIFSPWFCLGRCWAEWAVVGVRPQRRALGCGKAWGWGQNHQVTVLTLSSHGFVIPRSKFFKLSFSVKWNVRKLHDS